MTIPKVIHYIWLGGKDLPALEKKCLETWKKTNPDFEIIKWDEKNLNISEEVFHKALKKKEWAFCSDFARLKILKEHGGVYLDTDIELVSSLLPLLKFNCFVGKENPKDLNGAIIGSVKDNIFIKKCFDEIKESMKNDFVPIPRIMSEVYYRDFLNKNNDIEVFSSEYFYPYNPFESDVKNLFYSDITENTYSIHHWNYSWKPSFFNRVIRKIKRVARNSKYF